jgi:hypothetical protein
MDLTLKLGKLLSDGLGQVDSQLEELEDENIEDLLQSTLKSADLWEFFHIKRTKRCDDNQKRIEFQRIICSAAIQLYREYNLDVGNNADLVLPCHQAHFISEQTKALDEAEETILGVNTSFSTSSSSTKNKRKPTLDELKADSEKKAKSEADRRAKSELDENFGNFLGNMKSLLQNEQNIDVAAREADRQNREVTKSSDVTVAC